MGFLDGVKDAFGTGGDKPAVAEDRITPIDRWLGLDKELRAAQQQTVDQSVKYIDPADAANYITLELPKPMGISFVENDNECGGVRVQEILAEGSAAAAEPKLFESDQLVAVGSKLVLGNDFDTAFGEITASEGDTTRLVFFRGPTSFLYGPTKPAEEWYSENLL